MPADWPRRFIYVCNASRAAAVNALPITHAGLDRIAHVVIFCGAAGPDTTDANDRAEAVDPASRLARSLSDWTSGRLSEGKGTIQLLYGNPARIGDWSLHMQSVLDDADQPVIYNFKSGTKEMSIGAVRTLARNDPGAAMLVTIRDRPLQVELAGLNGQEPLPVRGVHLTLSRYLQLYGFQEHVDADAHMAHAQRAVFERWCRQNAAQINAFAAAFAPIAAQEWPTLEKLTKAVHLVKGSGAYKLPYSVRLDGTAQSSNPPVSTSLSRALLTLDGLPGLRLVKNKTGQLREFIIEDASVARFMRGTWIEAALFLALSALARNNNDVTVVGNLGLSTARAPHLRSTEIDVALMVRGQLVIIEAKSSVMTASASRDSAERSLAQLDSTKRQLIGQVGIALVVNPSMTRAKLERDNRPVIDRMVQGGTELFVGGNVLQEVIQRVSSLLSQSTTANT